MKYVLHYAELEILHFDSRQKSYKTNKKLKKSKKIDFKKSYRKIYNQQIIRRILEHLVLEQKGLLKHLD